MNELQKLMGGVDPTTRTLKKYKESWNNKLRYKKIKFQKLIETGRRIMDNANFERDKRNLFKKIEGGVEHVGQIPEIEKFVKFWGDIWEEDDRTPEIPWMESVRKQLRDKITNVKEFNIIEETHEKETMTMKNWTTVRINGIQNFCWKRLKPGRRELKRAFEQVKENKDLKAVWWPLRRTVLLPKTNDPKNYHPILCLNTSYKLPTGLAGKYMREHTMENDIWDEGQLGAVVGVLSTVD